MHQIVIHKDVLSPRQSSLRLFSTDIPNFNPISPCRITQRPTPCYISNRLPRSEIQRLHEPLTANRPPLQKGKIFAQSGSVCTGIHRGALWATGVAKEAVQRSDRPLQRDLSLSREKSNKSSGFIVHRRCNPIGA